MPERREPFGGHPPLSDIIEAGGALRDAVSKVNSGDGHGLVEEPSQGAAFAHNVNASMQESMAKDPAISKEEALEAALAEEAAFEQEMAALEKDSQEAADKRAQRRAQKHAIRLTEKAENKVIGSAIAATAIELPLQIIGTVLEIFGFDYAGNLAKGAAEFVTKLEAKVSKNIDANFKTSLGEILYPKGKENPGIFGNSTKDFETAATKAVQGMLPKGHAGKENADHITLTNAKAAADAESKNADRQAEEAGALDSQDVAGEGRS
jgi:ribosomal protein L13